MSNERERDRAGAAVAKRLNFLMFATLDAHVTLERCIMAAIRLAFFSHIKHQYLHVPVYRDHIRGSHQFRIHVLERIRLVNM